LLSTEGGWYAVLQVPTFSSEEDLTLGLLTEHGVLVHPGYFFDFPRESFLVISLLTPEADFAEGLRRILGVVSSPR
jgi:aspartate/methionine/tyrosine aminotransferase